MLLISIITGCCDAVMMKSMRTMPSSLRWSYTAVEIFFDTCVYHKPGVELLLSVIGVDNVLFGSEMLGAVKGIDPNTGDYFDDTKKYVDQLDLTDNDRHKLFEGNARRVFPRLDQRLTTLGL